MKEKERGENEEVQRNPISLTFRQTLLRKQSKQRTNIRFTDTTKHLKDI